MAVPIVVAAPPPAVGFVAALKTFEKERAITESDILEEILATPAFLAVENHWPANVWQSRVVGFRKR